MATIIVRTNPDKTTRKPYPFTCSICHRPVDTFDEGKACAEADYTRRTGRTTEARAA